MKEYLDFIKSSELKFTDFFINSILYKIDNDEQYLQEFNNQEFSNNVTKSSIIQYNNKVIEFLIKFTYSSEAIDLESMKSFILREKSDLDNKVLEELHPLYLANLDKFVLLKNKISSCINENQIINYKLNIDIDYSHQNMMNVDKAKAIVEFITNTNNSTIDCKERNLYELSSDELDDFLNNLREIYANIA